MLESNSLNRFFNECYNLNIQTVSDVNLLQYYHKLYNIEKEYKQFEEFINSYNDTEIFFKEKDKLYFDVIKDIYVNPLFFVFSQLNPNKFKINLNTLLFKLFEYNKYDEFINLVNDTVGKNSFFTNLKNYINDNELKIVELKQIDKKVKFVNDYIIKNIMLLDNDFDNLYLFINNFLKDKDFKFENKVENVNELFSLKNKNNLVISIDLKKANYQVLRLLKIVDNISFDDFISNYTNNNYFKINKQLRQIIYGNLCVSRIESFMRLIITYLSNDLKNSLKDVYIRSNDELVIIFNEKQINLDCIYDAIEKLENVFKQKIDFSIKQFQIKVIETNYGCFYYKLFEDGSFEIKNCNTVYYPQIYKMIKNIPICQNDLLYEDKKLKQIVSLLNPIEKIWNENLIKRYKQICWNIDWEHYDDFNKCYRFKNKLDIAVFKNEKNYKISSKIYMPLIEEFKMSYNEIVNFISDMFKLRSVDFNKIELLLN